MKKCGSKKYPCVSSMINMWQIKKNYIKDDQFLDYMKIKHLNLLIVEGSVVGGWGEDNNKYNKSPLHITCI